MLLVLYEPRNVGATKISSAAVTSADPGRNAASFQRRRVEVDEESHSYAFVVTSIVFVGAPVPNSENFCSMSCEHSQPV